jgi:uncharacterized membrane protein HdeD (DUF308 family)
MLQLMAKCWWIFTLRGILAVSFGFIAFLFWPLLSLDLFVWFFGLFALSEGVLSIIAVLIKHDEKYWWVIFLEGITGVLLGFVTLFVTGLSEEALLLFIGVWALITGIFEIIAAVRLRKEMKGDLSPGVLGVTSILFGLGLMAHRFGIGPSVYWLFGPFTSIFGILLIIISFRVRKIGTLYEKETSSRSF